MWKQINQRTFETKYVFYTTKAPGPGDGAPNGSDWWPAGHGVRNYGWNIMEGAQCFALGTNQLRAAARSSPVPNGSANWRLRFQLTVCGTDISAG